MTISHPARHTSGDAIPPTDQTPEESDVATSGRRRFLGYLVAAPTLATAATLSTGALGDSAGPFAPPRAEALPANPQVADFYDLEDALTDAARPTANLTPVVVGKDGRVSYSLPRSENGQGIDLAIAMVIAEEMNMPLDKVDVPLAPARPELVFNMFTGGSNSMNSLYYPVRLAAALAKGQLLQAAASQFGDVVTNLTARGGVILSAAGQSIGYGDLAEDAATKVTRKLKIPDLKPREKFTIVGKPTRRRDAREAVTGKKVFTSDIPNAMPCMVARADTINGTPKSMPNIAKVRKMPGVVGVAQIETGWAVAAKTFGQCIDAIRAMDVYWNPGPKAAESDDTVAKELKAVSLPFALPSIPGAKTVEGEYTFAFASNAPLEPGIAVADVKKDSAEVWTPSKIPIVAQFELSQILGIPQNAVKLNVMRGGGSFGRRLFPDAARDAVEASRAFGMPVKLMWHRVDECRQGRAHPMAFSKLKANVLNGNVVSIEQHHTSVRTDYSHGFGEALSSIATRQPLAGLSVSEIVFETTAIMPYSFGVTKQILAAETHQLPEDNAVNKGFKTTSMRNVYSPDVVTAHELFVDKLGASMGMDPAQIRKKYVKDNPFREVLGTLLEKGQWGRKLPAGFAQGIGLHREYKHTMGCLVEIDCRPETVNRKIRDAVTGPRVTRVTFVTLPGGIVVNPMGMEAMMQGGILDGIALALTSSVHLVKGAFLEGSWDNYFYSRQWNVPEEVNCIMLPADPNEKIAGGGEMGVAPSKAATACAYARAMGKQPTFWPMNHSTLSFTPKPYKPTVPEPPTNGLTFY